MSSYISSLDALSAVINRLKARAVAAEAERDEAERKREHSVQWYAERCEPLKAWSRSGVLTQEQRDQFFCIIANASPTVCGSRPPELTVQLNMMRHRAERAEAALDAVRQIAREALDAKEGA